MARVSPPILPQAIVTVVRLGADFRRNAVHNLNYWSGELADAASVVVITAALQVGVAILVEASLSFLGFGDRSQISWGYMLNNAQPFLRTAWWMSVFPGLALALTVLGTNLFADGLQAALDPRGTHYRYFCPTPVTDGRWPA